MTGSIHAPCSIRHTRLFAEYWRPHIQTGTWSTYPTAYRRLQTFVGYLVVVLGYAGLQRVQDIVCTFLAAHTIIVTVGYSRHTGNDVRHTQLRHQRKRYYDIFLHTFNFNSQRSTPLPGSPRPTEAGWF